MYKLRNILNETFSDKKYYHRSNNKFINFKVKGDDKYIKKHATDNGIYFTSTPNIKAYGPILYTVKLDINNPLYVKHYNSKEINPYTNRKINIEHITDVDLRYISELNIDAVISRLTGQVVVFDPKQIKILDITIDKENT